MAHFLKYFMERALGYILSLLRKIEAAFNLI